MSILRAQNLSKEYKNGDTSVFAVDKVNLNFKRGEFSAIIGASGSGKSTLLHMLGGLEYPTSGEVFYQDKNIYTYSDDDLSVLRRRRFGFVFQAYNLVQELTAYENIFLPVMLDKKKADTDYLNKIIEVLDIGDRLKHLPSALSGGQQQRVAIARALINKPNIIFADEPTGNLDAKSGREVLALLKEVSSTFGVSLILVTHDINIAEQAERLIELADGHIISDSALAKVHSPESSKA
jgi:putative ABC transport system ATP-binding protein